MDDEINRRIIDLNLTSTIMSCRTFTPQFKAAGLRQDHQRVQRL
jgi:hypothetical protein